MGYHVVDPDGVTPEPDRPCEKRSISDAAGLTELGCHPYRAEEAFVVGPGSPQGAYEDGAADDRLKVFSVGASQVDDVDEYEP